MDIRTPEKLPNRLTEPAPEALRFVAGFWLFAAMVAQWLFAACLVVHHV